MAGPSDALRPATRPAEVVHLDAALERSARSVTLAELQATGLTRFRAFQRSDVLREVLQVVDAFVEDRVRQVEGRLAGLLDRREAEARSDGGNRVLASLVDLGDLVDGMQEAFGSGQPALALRALEQRIQAVFRTHGYERIKTVGLAFDPQFHEIVEEVADASAAPHTILREVSRGYRRGTFVLRVARVVVAQSQGQEAAGQEAPGQEAPG